MARRPPDQNVFGSVSAVAELSVERWRVRSRSPTGGASGTAAEGRVARPGGVAAGLVVAAGDGGTWPWNPWRIRPTSSGASMEVNAWARALRSQPGLLAWRA